MFNEPTPFDIEDLKIYQQMGMSDDEYQMVKDILNRQPNYTEIGLFSVMWSEHCSYKNSKVILKTFPTKGEKILQGPGEGAGIVDIGDKQAVVFKIESHNHPSAVEPFQGAATGVGGIIRDVFSMGARPIALLNSLRFGALDNKRVKYLFSEVVAGIASYGNCVGVPTVGGEVYFDECYEGNPLVNAMCVGLINHEDIKKGQAHGVGNTVMYVGADTGCDGIHGATFASEELSEDSDKKRPSVQVGDPFMEKLLLEACLDVIKHPALVGIQDMGAAGLISSSCEMASKAGMGIKMELDNIPQREKNMSAYEIMLSESQERMLLIIEKGKEDEICKIFEKYGLHAVSVGVVTDDKQMKIYHHGKLVADVPADALASKAPEYHKPQKEADYYKQFEHINTHIDIDDANQTLLDLLKQPTIASKKWIYQQYDQHVRTCTVVPPSSDAAVIRIRDTRKALAMTTDCNARYVYLDPEVGGQIAVAEAARNIIASGGNPLAITDNLNFGAPENPEIFWQMVQSAKGISEACIKLNTPVIGGNVSMYNERGGVAIYPTPTIGMVGLVEDLNHITTQHLKEAGDLIYLLGDLKNDFGGSELQKMTLGKIEGRPPVIDLDAEKQHGEALLQSIKLGLVRSAHDLAEGGFAVALSETLFTHKNLGASVSLDVSKSQLFAESQSCYIVSVSADNKKAFEHACPNAKLIGAATDDARLIIKTNNVEAINLSVEALRSSFENAIPDLMA